MTRTRKVGWALSLVILFATGALGLYNGLRELSYTLTPLQRSVSVGVLVYGVLGVLGGMALASRRRSSIWLAATWGAVTTYVAAFAPIAYAGDAASVLGAVASGLATALLATGVIWSARVSTRRSSPPPAGHRLGAAAIAAVLLAGMAALGACR